MGERLWLLLSLVLMYLVHSVQRAEETLVVDPRPLIHAVVEDVNRGTTAARPTP